MSLRLARLRVGESGCLALDCAAVNARTAKHAVLVELLLVETHIVSRVAESGSREAQQSAVGRAGRRPYGGALPSPWCRARGMLRECVGCVQELLCSGTALRDALH